MKELSNYDIAAKLSNNPNFGGVINKDDLKKLPERKVFILNIDSKKPGHNGTHWTLVSNLDKNFVWYFDSFGIEPPEHMLKLMEQTGKEIFYNNKQLQGLNTNSCGEFCIYVAKELFKGRTPLQIMEDFSTSVDKNERILKGYFYKEPEKIRVDTKEKERQQQLNEINPFYQQHKERQKNFREQQTKLNEINPYYVKEKQKRKSKKKNKTNIIQ